MICTECKQEVEEGAVFCGNCGHPTGLKHSLPKPAHHAPEYALAKPTQHKGEVASLIAVILAVMGIPGAIVPVLGLALGIFALVIATTIRRSHKRLANLIAIIAACVAIVVSLGSWAYTLTHEKELSKMKNKPSGETSMIVSTSKLDTTCFTLQFAFSFNTDHDKYDNCDVRVFEGQTIEMSNNVYKVYGNKVPSINETNIADKAKEAIEKDVSTTLPGFTISGARYAQFAGSPAYIVNAVDAQNNIAVVEAAVFHESPEGYNLFSLVHATKGANTDLGDLEDAWQWK